MIRTFFNFRRFCFYWLSLLEILFASNLLTVGVVYIFCILWYTEIYTFNTYWFKPYNGLLNIFWYIHVESAMQFIYKPAIIFAIVATTASLLIFLRLTKLSLLDDYTPSSYILKDFDFVSLRSVVFTAVTMNILWIFFAITFPTQTWLNFSANTIINLLTWFLPHDSWPLSLLLKFHKLHGSYWFVVYFVLFVGYFIYCIWDQYWTDRKS